MAPNDTLARYFLGWTAYELGDHEEAIDHWHRLTPEQIAQGYAKEAQRTFLVGDTDKTAQLAKLALELDPNLSDAYYQLGRTYAESGEWEKAIDTYQHGLSLTNESYLQSSLYRALGRAYAALNDPQSAVDSLERAVGLEPLVYLARLELADQYTQLKQYNDARSQLEVALVLEDEDPRAYIKLGELYHKQGLVDKAEAWHLRAIEKDSYTGRAQYAYARFLLQQERSVEAVGYLEQAMQYGWNYHWVQMDLGAAYTQLGRLEDAVDIYSELAIVEGASDRAVRSWIVVAQLYMEMGNQSAAMETWHKVLALDPNNPQALEATGQ